MSDDPAGGLGGGTRDTRLIEKAVRERWEIPDTLRKVVPLVMANILSDPKATRRNKMTAARVLLSADALNLEQEKRDSGGERVNLNVQMNVDQRRQFWVELGEILSDTPDKKAQVGRYLESVLEQEKAAAGEVVAASANANGGATHKNGDQEIQES